MFHQRVEQAIQQSTGPLISPRNMGITLLIIGFVIGGITLLNYDVHNSNLIIPGVISFSLISLGCSLMARRKYLSFGNLVAALLPLLLVVLCLFLLFVALTLGCMAGTCV